MSHISINKVIGGCIFIAGFLLSGIVAAQSTSTTTTPTTTNNTCPTGKTCCPDMSNTMIYDQIHWQLTGQPLTSNSFSMAWWALPNYKGEKGYITCYYNMNAKNPYTLESIAPTTKPDIADKSWEKGKLEGTMTCLNTVSAQCPFASPKF